MGKLSCVPGEQVSCHVLFSCIYYFSRAVCLGLSLARPAGMVSRLDG